VDNSTRDRLEAKGLWNGPTDDELHDDGVYPTGGVQIQTELEAANTRIAELEAMLDESGNPSVVHIVGQRNYAVGALKERDRLWQRAMRAVLEPRVMGAVSRKFIELRDGA